MSSVVLHSMDQGSPEWFAQRAGKVTASVFSDVLAKGEGKTRRSLMLKLAGEILTGEPMANYTNADMQRGKDQEDDARNTYALLHDAEPVRVGFIEDLDARAGASPDALIGEDGVLEIKCALPHVLIDKLMRGTFPSEHVAQCQGALWIARREWVDIAVYCPKMPLFVKRATRDETYISVLAKAVALFNEELDETVDRVRRYGQPSTLSADLTNSLIAPDNILIAG